LNPDLRSEKPASSPLNYGTDRYIQVLRNIGKCNMESSLKNGNSISSTNLRVADKAGIVLRNVKNIVRKTSTTNGHR
jgi:hypothetical protein